jgi:CDP-diacylglycerol--serine O-phosphatidyltransferase
MEATEKSKLLKNNIANIISLLIVPLSLIAFYYLYIKEVFLAFLFISLCFYLDTIDGYISRKLKIESELGRSIDSFCDFIIYLIFPIYFIFQYLSFNLLMTFLISVLVLITGIIKLNRFNSEGFIIVNGEKYYRGMMVPYVLLCVAICYIIYSNFFGGIIYLIPFVMMAISILMVSSIKFKKTNNYLWYLLMVLILWMIY